MTDDEIHDATIWQEYAQRRRADAYWEGFWLGVVLANASWIIWWVAAHFA